MGTDYLHNDPNTFLGTPGRTKLEFPIYFACMYNVHESVACENVHYFGKTVQLGFLT